MAKGEFLGDFEQLVLFAILRLGEGAYGLAVRREIEARAGRKAAIGAVYATLERLESKGLIESEDREGGAEREGRARRFFRVTGEGSEALSRSYRSLRNMAEGLIG